MDILSSKRNRMIATPKALLSLVFVVILASMSTAHASDIYQLNVLFNPGQGDLEAEARGRVMIYDSLKNETVEKALNEQFGRIDHMMFIRTRYIQESGEYDTEEEDCD